MEMFFQRKLTKKTTCGLFIYQSFHKLFRRTVTDLLYFNFLFFNNDYHREIEQISANLLSLLMLSDLIVYVPSRIKQIYTDMFDYSFS